MSSKNGQYRTTQNRTNAMNVVMRALMSRQFESGRFQIERADKDKYELAARLKFKRVPEKVADTYAQIVDILVGIKFVDEARHSTLATWMIKVNSTRQENELLKEIDQTIMEVLGEHGSSAKRGDVMQPTEPVKSQPAQSSNSPVQPFVSNYGDQMMANTAADPAKADVAAASNAVPAGGPLCTRCQSPKGLNYNFCLNCGHSFGF